MMNEIVMMEVTKNRCRYLTEKPSPDCPDAFYNDVLKPCLAFTPSARPGFAKLSYKIQTIVASTSSTAAATTVDPESGGGGDNDFMTGFGDAFPTADDDDAAPPPPPPKKTEADFGGGTGDDLSGFDGFGGSWGNDDAAQRAAAESEDDESTDYEGYDEDEGGGGGGGGNGRGGGGGEATRRVAAQLDLYYNPEDLGGSGSPTDVDVYAVVESTSWPVKTLPPSSSLSSLWCLDLLAKLEESLMG